MYASTYWKNVLLAVSAHSKQSVCPQTTEIVQEASSIDVTGHAIKSNEHGKVNLPISVSGISTVLLNNRLHQRVGVQSQQLCPLPPLKTSQAWHQSTISDDKTEQHDTITAQYSRSTTDFNTQAHIHELTNVRSIVIVEIKAFEQF